MGDTGASTASMVKGGAQAVLQKECCGERVFRYGDSLGRRNAPSFHHEKDSATITFVMSCTPIKLSLAT